jgi:glycosyltransferase involved in cell wall biosynthesis
VMFPVIEQAGHDRCHFHNKVLYHYDNSPKAERSELKRAVESKKDEEQKLRGTSHPYWCTEKTLKAGVTVVVSSYNQRPDLEMFLEAMYFQSMPPVEVIVADDGSTDATVHWIEAVRHKFPFEISWLSRKNEGYRLASLNNLGARQASSERIMFTNADVIHGPRSIEAHFVLPARMVGAGLVKGIVRQEGIVEAIRSRKINFLPPDGRSNLSFMGLDPEKDQAGVWGGNLSVPTRAFCNSEYDESYIGWGGEDADMVGRLVKMGMSAAWVKGSIGYHMKHEFRDYHQQAQGAKKYILENK